MLQNVINMESLWNVNVISSLFKYFRKNVWFKLQYFSYIHDPLHLRKCINREISRFYIRNLMPLAQEYVDFSLTCCTPPPSTPTTRYIAKRFSDKCPDSLSLLVVFFLCCSVVLSVCV